MSTPKILLVGATGYIGGSVLSTILDSAVIPKSSLTILVRGEDKAKVFQDLGLNTILFTSLDETSLIQNAASEHDIIIGTAIGWHPSSAEALIRGLAQRKAQTGREVHLIQ